MSDQPPYGHEPEPPSPPAPTAPTPPAAPVTPTTPTAPTAEEWRRYEEWQRYEQWRRAQWEQWQAWQHQQWLRQWQAHHERLAAQQPGQGRGAEPPSFPHAEPTPYHLVLRTWTYAWWRPAVGIFLLVLGMLVVVPLLVLPVLLVGVAIEGGDGGFDGYLDALTRALDLTELSPSGLLWLNLSLGGLILWTWALVRFLHNLRPRWLTSVMPKMRWRFFWACMGIAVVALVAQVVAGMLIPTAGDPSLQGGANPVTGQTVALLVVVVLTTPLQAAGEEYAFRGYLLQAVGALTKRAWIALTVTSLLFAMAHGVQNFPLFFDRFAFGFIAGWLVIRTGGLEAGIALHVLNNLLAFGLGILFGDIGEMVNVSEISWWNIPVTLTQSLLYVLLVLYVARRMNVQRLSRPPAAEEPEREPEPVA
jgi:membrane protease YdiL (CAAX protease family)